MLIGSLLEFKKLTKLRLATYFIFAVPDDPWPPDLDPQSPEITKAMLLDILPPHIEFLTITHCDRHLERTCAAVMHLVEHATSFPSLVRIDMEINDPAFSSAHPSSTRRRAILGPMVSLADQMSVRLVVWHEPMHVRRQDRNWGFDASVQWADATGAINTRGRPPRVVAQSMSISKHSDS